MNKRRFVRVRLHPPIVHSVASAVIHVGWYADRGTGIFGGDDYSEWNAWDAKDSRAPARPLGIKSWLVSSDDEKCRKNRVGCANWTLRQVEGVLYNMRWSEALDSKWIGI